jgi:hypothetical protein
VSRPIRTAVRPQAVSLHTATYLISDAAQKAADVTEKAVGSVNAPSWVLPAAAIGTAVILSASSFLLKPGAEAAEKIQQRDSGKWNNYKK